MFWSAKGGAGCTTVALGVALATAVDQGVLLVDLGGDALHALGAPAPAVGIFDWLASDAPAAALGQIETDIGSDGLSVLSPGRPTTFDPARIDALVHGLRDERREVVVDIGVLTDHEAPMAGVRRCLVEELGCDTLVTRPCYLALRRATALDHRPDRVVVVAEAGRSLGAHDVEAAMGVGVVGLVDVDPAVSRAIDAGMLDSRLPRVFARQLRSIR